MAKRKKKSIDSSVGVCYARYSSHRQKDVSIEQQVAACQAHAAKRGITLIDSYEDRAVSGRSDKRPAFRQMMADAEKGAFAYVIAWKSNRIGRNMIEAMLNEARLSELGVKVLYVEEDFDDTAAGQFCLRTMMNVNQFYSDNMAEDIRRGMRDNAINCKINGRIPFGYKRGEDGKFCIDEPRAAVVREIYRRIASGESFASIADDLNARGIRTSRGRQWTRTSFCRLVSNEKYRGLYLYEDIRIEEGVPRIVSNELFDQVQHALKTKKNPRGGKRNSACTYLLTGRLFCGYCKSPMIGVCGTGRNGMHYYYACKQHRNEHTCAAKSVRKYELEQAVAQAIKTYVLVPEVIDAIADSAVAYAKKLEAESPVAVLEDQLANVQASIKNLLRAIESGILTETTKSRLLELEAEQAELTRQIRVAQSTLVKVDKPAVVAWLDSLRRGEVEDEKYIETLINTFVAAVYVYDDELKIIFTHSGGSATVPPEAIKNADTANLDDSYPVRLCRQWWTFAEPGRTAIYMAFGLFILLCPYPSRQG